EWPLLSAIIQRTDLEHAAAVAVKSDTDSESTVGVINNLTLGSEGLFSVASEAPFRLAAAAVCRSDTLLVVDALTSGISVLPSELLFLEWLDPPNLMEISIDRLLRSPGRIRILASRISNRPTKGR